MTVAKLNENSKVRVINNTKGSVSFKDFNDKKQLFPKPNSYKDIELVVLTNLYNDYANFIDGGYIIFEDLRVYGYLGVPEEIYSKIIPLDKIKEFLEKDAESIKLELSEMSQTMKENVAMVAKEQKIDSKKKVRAIKDATGFNVEDFEE